MLKWWDCLNKVLKKAFSIELSTFELIISIISLIAVIGWLYLVYKLSITIDNINNSLSLALGT